MKIFLRLLSMAIIVGVLAVAWGVIEYENFITTPLAFGGKTLHYEVKPGTGVMKIAQDLDQRGVIKHWIYLVGLARLEGKAHLIKAGEYEFQNGITPVKLLDQLVAGQVVEHALTIVEGWNFKQLMDAIKQNTAITHTLSGMDGMQIMAKLGWAGQHPEGHFYPDTYHFSKGMTDVAFLQRAYRAMEQRLATEWDTRNAGLPLQDPYQALILASIVEKESALPDERKRIAGVFIRRLQKGMKLQTDPTVIYGMGSNFDGNLRRADLTTDTAYNTYLHTGLPPTPIALPSAAAIHAVLHPEPGNSLYFVARGDGSHEFSASIDAHNKAVKKYQLKGRGSSALNKAVQSAEHPQK